MQPERNFLSNISLEEFKDRDVVVEFSDWLFKEGYKDLTLNEICKALEKIFDYGYENGIHIMALLSIPGRLTNQGEKSGIDAALIALIELSRKPNFKEDLLRASDIHDAFNILLSRSNLLHPTTIWEVVIKYFPMIDIDHGVKTKIAALINDNIAFGDKKKIIEGLVIVANDIPTDNYGALSNLIESIKFLWSTGYDEYAKKRKVPNFYIELLDYLVPHASESYLLTCRVNMLKNSLLSDIPIANEARDRRAFKISKDYYALKLPGNDLQIIANDDSLDRAREVEGRLNRLEQSLIDAASNYATSRPQNITLSPEHRSMLANLTDQHRQIGDGLLSDFIDVQMEGHDSLLGDYTHMNSAPMREIITTDIGIDLLNLTLQEQLYFLNYLKNISNEKISAVREFIHRYSINGLRSFLSISKGGFDLGHKIIDFGLNSEYAETVFQYYSDLLDAAESATELVRSFGLDPHVLEGIVHQVRNNILNRAHKDLEKALLSHSDETLENLVQHYVSEAKTYIALLQETHQGNIEISNSQDLTSTQKSQMTDLLTINYERAYPNTVHTEFKELVLASLLKSFSNPDTEFRYLTHEDRIIAFNRFDTISSTDEGEYVYFGSFNVDPAYSGAGSIMLEQSIHAKAHDEEIPMKAHCDPYQPITKKYLDIGFYVTDHFNVAGNSSFEIVFNRDTSSKLSSPQMTISELIDLPFHLLSSISVRIIREDDDFPELQQNYVGTKMFKHQGSNYIVFEKL